MRDIKNFFTAEDFAYVTGYDGMQSRAAVVALRANALLREYIEECPRVANLMTNEDCWWAIPPYSMEYSAHTARLVDIREIGEGNEGKD